MYVHKLETWHEASHISTVKYIHGNPNVKLQTGVRQVCVYAWGPCLHLLKTMYCTQWHTTELVQTPYLWKFWNCHDFRAFKVLSAFHASGFCPLNFQTLLQHHSNPALVLAVPVFRTPNIQSFVKSNHCLVSSLWIYPPAVLLNKYMWIILFKKCLHCTHF